MQIERASSHFSNLIASVTRKFLIRLRGNFVPAARALPILVGIAILAATLVLWQGLIAQEQGAIEQEIQLQATNSKIAIADDLQEVTQALVRMVKRWEHQGKPSKEDWEADAALYIQHYGTFQAISWTDPSSYVRWIVPLAGNEAALNLNVASEPKRRIALEAARNKGMAVFTQTIDLQQGGKGFLVYVPIGAGQNFSGFIVGVFRTQQFFNNIFKELDKRVGRKYAVSIFDGNEEIYSHYLNNRLNEKKWVLSLNTPSLLLVSVDALRLAWTKNCCVTSSVICSPMPLSIHPQAAPCGLNSLVRKERQSFKFKTRALAFPQKTNNDCLSHFIELPMLVKLKGLD